MLQTMRLLPWMALVPTLVLAGETKNLRVSSRPIPRALAVNLSAATLPLDWIETRESYVKYPDEASSLLVEELEVIAAAVGLDVTTSLTHPDQHFQVWSLMKGLVHRFRKQNQVIHSNPHYFISTGLEVGCRNKFVNPDTNQQEEVETVPIPGHCQDRCSNHGRYCLMQGVGSQHTGLEIIEETLRRICFAQIYHASDLRFWEYMEALEQLNCATSNTTAQCSEQALQQVKGTSYKAIEHCMHLAGGTEMDNPNVHLQYEVDHRKSSNEHKGYVVGDLPMLHVGGKKYLGDDWSLQGIFPFVCEIYREQTSIKPLACHFCEACGDVRKCLWKLECDGKPFDADKLSILSTPPPAIVLPTTENGTVTVITTTTPPDSLEDETPSSAPSSSPTWNNYEERKRQQEEMDELYFRWFLAACAILAIVFTIICIREGRRRRQAYIAEQFKRDTQARWRARELDGTPDDYSTSWPMGLVQSSNNSDSRFSRKNRHKRSVRDQRINQDHSHSGQRTRRGSGLFQGFGRSSLENTPSPGFQRHLSLDSSTAALRPGRLRRAVSLQNDNRLSPAHAATLMEAATRSTPLPAEPVTTSTAARLTPTKTLEDIFSEDEASASEEGEQQLGPDSERSNSDQLSYSTNWLTASQTQLGATGAPAYRDSTFGDANDAANYEGLEDVTTL